MTVDLAALLDQRQHVTIERFLASGASRSAWDRAHRTGKLVRVHPGVSRVAVAAAAPEHAMHAALLAGGDRSMLSHVSSAWVWGAEVVGHRPVDLTVPDRRRGLRLAGVRLHRPVDLDDLRPVVRQGFAVTSPIRTALDIGAVVPPDIVAEVIESFLVQRLVTVAQLRRALQRHSRSGRSGLGGLRLVLDEWSLGDVPPDSVLEVAMARLLRQHGLPPAVFHHVVRTGGRTYELDFAIVDLRIDIEIDGWAFHGGRQAFEADRARDAELTAGGWLVIRFTWHQVRQRPVWVASRIAALVAQRARSVS